MEKIKFAAIGTGWRVQFFLRVALELPEFFEVAAVVEPNEERAKEFAKNWSFPIVKTAEEVNELYKPEFFVLSRTQRLMPELVKDLTDKGNYILAETFVMKSTEELTEFYKSIKNKALFQSAEQYIFQPLHTARLNVIADGVVGTVSHAQVSAAHGYHGLSLIRNFLNAQFDNCTIKAHTYKMPIIKGPKRKGYEEKEEIIDGTQQFAVLDFGDKWATFDFINEQYFSQIRKNRVLIRGERGEIDNKAVRAYIDHKTPFEYDLKAYISGLEGDCASIHTGHISGGAKVYYKNRFGTARISDDEIAVAESLYRMGMYVRGGEPCYSLEESCQDQYLTIMMKKSDEENIEVKTETQIWAK